MNQQQITDTIEVVKEHVQQAAQFVLNRLKNFKDMTMQEQIAYPVFALGILLFFVSIILFIL
jgi:hypothetical protein